MDKKERNAVLYAFFFLILFVVLLAIMYIFFSLTFDQIAYQLIILCLIPFFIYLLATDRIEYIRGGGFEVKLRSTVDKETEFQKVARVLKYSIIEKRDLERLRGIIESISYDPNVVLSLTHREPGGGFDRWVLADYLKALLRFETFIYVIFIRNETLIGYMLARRLLGILQAEYEPEYEDERIMNYINTGRFSRIPGFREVNKMILEGSTRKEALKKMEDEGLNELLVINRYNEFLGIVRKEDIVSRILLELISK